MTSYAFGVHEELVQERGINPNTDEYYEMLDKEIRKAFPDKFKSDQGNRQRQERSPGNVVTPPVRDSSKPRSVRLTTTQVAIAKRLGLTPEQYARQMIEDQENG